MSDNDATQVEQLGDTKKEKQPEIKLLDVIIKDENTALNVVIGMLFLAHKRGVFSVEESAKIWECVSQFQKSSTAAKDSQD